MAFSGYLVEYTLIHMFHGNRSAYARAVDMDEGNLRRLIRSIVKGKAGHRLVDQTIDLYTQAQIDVSHIISDYQALASSNSRLKAICAFDFFITRAMIKIDEDGSSTYQAVRDVIHKMEVELCGKNENRRPECKFYHTMGQFIDMDEKILRTCPCRRLYDFVDSLGASV